MVEFGDNKQKWVAKKNSLAKRLQGGFLLATSVSQADVWEAIHAVVDSFPERKSFLKRGGMAVFQLRKQADTDVVGWGALTKNGEMGVADWALGVRPTEGGFHLYLAHGKAVSGKVEGATEMEGFIGLLEAQVSAHDPAASIDFVIAE